MTRRNIPRLADFAAAAPGLARREWLQATLAGMAGLSAANWFGELARAASGNPDRRRACILLWMSGGPSQIDTFDPKPEHANGGDVKAIATNVPGIRISENLPKLAALMNDLVVVRSMTTKEGDHERGSYLMRTGYRPIGPLHYPVIGALYAKELAAGRELDLPPFISISPRRIFGLDTHGPGFLGPQFAPLFVGEANGGPDQESMAVENLSLPGDVNRGRHDQRLSILGELEDGFARRRPGAAVDGHRTAYAGAVRMMRSEMVEAFQLDQEPAELRAQYGESQFGRGCLLARRLVERGVPFVEVTLSGAGNRQVLGWDTHQNNRDSVKQLCEVLDPAWSTLIQDLRSRGLLETTTIVWMGEFGRTPGINNNAGRDHFPAAWSTVLSGGGLRGGQVIGRTTDDGMKVDDRPVETRDLLATVCRALGIDGTKQNMSNVGRPIRIVEPESKPITEALLT
jgi:hypothetical protein